VKQGIAPWLSAKRDRCDSQLDAPAHRSRFPSARRNGNGHRAVAVTKSAEPTVAGRPTRLPAVAGAAAVAPVEATDVLAQAKSARARSPLRGHGRATGRRCGSQARNPNRWRRAEGCTETAAEPEPTGWPAQ